MCINGQGGGTTRISGCMRLGSVEAPGRLALQLHFWSCFWGSFCPGDGARTVQQRGTRSPQRCRGHRHPKTLVAEWVPRLSPCRAPSHPSLRGGLKVLCHLALVRASGWDGQMWGKRNNHPFLRRSARFCDIPNI